MSDLITELNNRGLIDASSHENIAEYLQTPRKVYCGFDPTSDSLHLGNLMGIIALKWFQKYGHTPVLLVGGATARIGDPSGKSVERPLLDESTIVHNSNAIKKLLSTFYESEGDNKPLIVNNYNWMKNISFIDFLRDIGKEFRLSTMLAKDSVKTRVNSEEGMSFTEFSYQILQSYDFYHLHQSHNVELQIGGSDQWGNITAGIEFVRKKSQKSVQGLTFPLLLRSDGKKFGKSEEGAIWLDSNKCSYYQFYQYFIRIPDQDVVRMLKRLTFLDLQAIDEIEKEMESSLYQPNSAQKVLAEEMTRFVHGENALEIAKKVTQAAAPGAEMILEVSLLDQIKSDFPLVKFKKDEIVGKPFVELMSESKIVPSKSEAHKLVKNNGAYLNNQRIENPKKVIEHDDIVGGKFIVLAAGKKKKLLIELE